MDYFGSARAAWEADELSLGRAGLDHRAVGSLRQTRGRLDPGEELARTLAAGIDVLTWDDKVYPSYLKEIPDPPPVLYLRGDLQPRDQWAVAVVGTRRLTSYGKHVARQLVADLVASGVTIVSGLARGIDGIAHQAALEMGGRTLAVLGSGIDHIYPPEHRSLAQRIAQQGAILSDFPPETSPEPGNFPRRNRIVSGLSLGVLVIEAGERSGATITARCALEQGRDVFAVPGNINARASLGTNRLIQQGAKLVLNANDVLEELNMTMVEQHVAVQLALPETREEAYLLQMLSDQPCHVDELSRSAGLPVAQVTSALTMMELKGMVRQLEGMHYIRVRERGPEYGMAHE
jgi:DNA processing protein